MKRQVARLYFFVIFLISSAVKETKRMSKQVVNRITLKISISTENRFLGMIFLEYFEAEILEILRKAEVQMIENPYTHRISGK